MKKRLQKKEYKRVLKAKEMLDDWSGDLFKSVEFGYLKPTRKTALGRAIRKVVQTGFVYQTWDWWSFQTPQTKDVMNRKDSNYIVPIEGTLYNLCTYGEYPYGRMELDLRRIMSDREYKEKILSSRERELAERFLRDLAEYKG